MPYHVPSKPDSNYWFSCSDGHTVQEFTSLLCEKNIDLLQASGGFCIVFTHFASGFTHADTEIVDDFHTCIRRISERNGWYVPAGTLLDYLASVHERDGRNHSVPYWYLLRLDLLWLRDRIIKKIRFRR
jgi:hypothetical protein